MYSPTTRVLTVLELLQSHYHLSGPELAARLEVDIRTVRRYITMLQDLGIPIEATRGRYGAYRLLPGFKLPPLMFTEDEALAVTLGLLTARRQGLTAAAPAVEGALAKIERVMPHVLRQRIQALREVLVLDDAPVSVPPESAVVVALSVAAQQRQRVQLRYRSWQGEETARALDPYGLAYRSGRWYTVGYCHLRQDIRVFRLDRVLEVTPRGDTFTRPPDFDSFSHVERAIANTPGVWHVEALLQLPLAQAQCSISPALGTLEETPAGIVLRCYVQELDWIAYFLIGLRCSFIVRQPAELRDALRQLAARTGQAAEATTDTIQETVRGSRPDGA